MKLYREIWKAANKQKGTLLVNLLVSCILAFSGPFSLYAHAYFIDKIKNMVGTGFNISLLIYPTVILLLSFCLPMLNMVTSYLSMKYNHSIDLSWNRRMNEIIRNIPYDQYEHEATYDKIKQIGDNNIYSTEITCFFSAASTICSIIFYIFILMNISIWLTASVIILAPAVGYFSSKIADKQYKKIYKMNPDRRRGIYKSSILRSREYAKDIRMYRCGDYMISDWFDTQKDIDSKTLRIKFQYGFLSALVAKTEYVVIFINLFIVFLSYLHGSITLGVFISISNQIFSMRLLTKVQALISQRTTAKSMQKTYAEVLALMKENDDKSHYINNKITIEFKNVYFKYPNQDDYILKNITLRFHAGESIAIVGENGAGKSTLIKLLLGLYKPNEGEILINGTNLSTLSLSERAEIFGVAFQDYSKFCLPLKENLTLSADEQDTVRIARCFGIDSIADSLKNGYETVLGKSFGEAIDVSVGQWQSIAIARALIGEKKVFVFDEPTASLDPIREVEAFENIRSITHNRMTIFITHRLGFTTKVDRIILIKENQIIENGSFVELIGINGEFYKMFETQKGLYTKGDAI